MKSTPPNKIQQIIRTAIVALLLGYSTVSEHDRFLGFTGPSLGLALTVSTAESLSGEGEMLFLFLRLAIGCDSEEPLVARKGWAEG